MVKISKEKLFKLIIASMKTKLYHPNNFRNIEVPMQHRSPNFEYDGKEWREDNFNYRLDYPIDDIFYAVFNDKVVGHLGIDSDMRIKAVYVDPKYRRQGVSQMLHEDAFKALGVVYSDDFDAMEPEEKKLWEKLMAKLPHNIQQLDDKSYVFKS